MQDAAKNQGGAFTGFVGMNMAQQGGGMNAAQLFQMGTTAMGKFCSECGAKRPSGAPEYRCDKCSWQPADPAHPPKFCPECGDPFDDQDLT